MTKRSRTILFSILTALFLTITPGIALYSWGYRFDFDSGKIVQTGAFYFKVFPRSAEIYLDGKRMKKTDFFFGASYVENLLPKKYEVEIKKDGFHPWKKTLEVKEKQVTDAKNVVLIPEEPEFSILTKGVENFFFSPDGKKVILKEAKNGAWALKLLEPEKNVKSHLFAKEDISKTEISISAMNFSPDSQRILLKTALKEGFKYFLINLEKSPPDLVSLDFLERNVKDVFFGPRNSQKLFLLKNGGIYEADLTQKKISQIILENVKSFQVLNENIYYLLDSGPDAGFLFKTDFSFSGREKINKSPFPVVREEECKIFVFSDKIFLQDEQNLYMLNSSSNNFEKFFETSKEPKISSDLKKIVYYSDYEIWILFLKNEFSQPQKSAGEKQFIARFSEKIGNVFWLSSHYLIFNYPSAAKGEEEQTFFDSGSKIKIAEIDDRNKVNIADFAPPTTTGGGPEIFFNQNDKKLYISSEGNLYSSERLVP